MMHARMKVHGKRRVGRPKDSQRYVQEKINHETRKHSLKGKHNEIAKMKASDAPAGPSSTSENVLTFPVLKTIDREKMLPRYSAILNRSAEEGVVMDDLDALQLELESLLSAVVVRSRVLRKEVNTLTNKEEKRKRGNFGNKHRHKTSKVRNSHDKPAKKLKESKVKDAGKTPTAIKFTKVKGVPASISSSANICLPDHESRKSKHDSPRLVNTKFDAPNKFWASVDSYCGDITRDDIRFLEELAKECEVGEEYQSIPSLGRHYSLRWADEDMNSEQEESRGESKSPNKNCQLESQTLLKKGEKACEVSSGPLTQRLVSTLMEENVKLRDSEKSETKTAGGENVTPRTGLFRTFVANNTVNCERRVRKELEDQGILENNDQSKESNDDEILQEIKRCQNELQTLNDYNHMHLKRLINLAEVQITRQELKKKLHRVDCDVMESYRNIVAGKQKKKALSKAERDVCWKALKEREALIKQLDVL